MTKASKLAEKLAAGGTAFGAWAALGSAFAAELMCAEGVDYVCIDQQHGLADYGVMLGMLRAIEARGVGVLTRVPCNDAALIGKALDAGAHGVIVPMVSTPAQAAQAVAACRYPPKGMRSYGPVRAAMSLGTTDLAVLGDGVLCLVMVETREGLEHVDAIASTPGIDGIYVGPADLALGLGMSPDLDKREPEHVAAVDRILQACDRHGVVAGIQCSNGRAAFAMAQRGFRLVTFTKDSALIPAAAKHELAQAHGRSGERAAEVYT